MIIIIRREDRCRVSTNGTGNLKSCPHKPIASASICNMKETKAGIVSYLWSKQIRRAQVILHNLLVFLNDEKYKNTPHLKRSLQSNSNSNDKKSISDRHSE